MKMKKSKLLLISLFLYVNYSFINGNTLIVGEKLVFDVSWQFIKVGYGTLEVKNILDYNGTKAYHIYSEAKSAPFFDIFYKVRDTNESWVDINRFYSLAFKQSIKEGGYKRERFTKYDQKNHKATNQKNEIFDIPNDVLDVLSAFYWVRLQKLESGSVLKVNVNSHNKSYLMNVNIHNREILRIGDREYNTIIVEPELQDSGLFMQKGATRIWLTDDEKHIPVKMTSKVKVGTIIAELNEKESMIGGSK